MIRIGAPTGAAVMPLLPPQGIHSRGAVGRADRQAAKPCLRWLQQLLAQPLAGLNSQIQALRDVANALSIGDLAVKKVPHKEVPREADAARRLQGGDELGRQHDRASVGAGAYFLAWYGPPPRAQHP